MPRSAPRPATWTLTADVVLFDLDGTLVDSSAAITAAWRRWCDRYDVDLARVLAIMPGRPGMAVMREVRPDLPESVLASEQAAMIDAEIADTGSVVAMPGATDLLGALAKNQWAIVTACTGDLARARLRAAGLPVPDVLIGSDSVQLGKPDPAGYLGAASMLGASPRRSVVIEDAPAGVAAGKAAGMRVVALPPAASGPAAADCYPAPALSSLRIEPQPAPQRGPQPRHEPGPRPGHDSVIVTRRDITG